jgi:predicted cupin superfamily sugar epimerase
MMKPRDIVEVLGLEPHPEGGWYRETWSAAASGGGRATGTAIYYLLEEGQVSRWHRVDAAEIWHWYAGAALELTLSADGRSREVAVLGSGIEAGERPQVLVPAGCWQSAVSRGAFTLVGCTVSPGFEFRGFEMAPAGWEPGD